MMHQGLTDLIENVNYDSIIKANEQFDQIENVSLQKPGVHKLFQDKFSIWFNEHIEQPNKE